MENSKIRDRINRKLAAYRAAKQAYKRERRAIKDVKRKLEVLDEAQGIAQHVAQSVQSEVHGHIASIVSRCLSAVFDDAYDFRLLFERKRGKTDCRLLFERNGEEIDPMTAAGGGVVDVAAFALRLSALVLQRPKARPVLILDEPFRFVSANYRPRVRQLIEQLAEELRVQFIIVTHDRALETGRIVEL